MLAVFVLSLYGWLVFLPSVWNVLVLSPQRRFNRAMNPTFYLILYWRNDFFISSSRLNYVGDLSLLLEGVYITCKCQSKCIRYRILDLTLSHWCVVSSRRRSRVTGLLYLAFFLQCDIQIGVTREAISRRFLPESVPLVVCLRPFGWCARMHTK